jgi:hypothetical protein
MSESSGQTTTVTPGAATAGTQKQSDLPPPVGITAKTSGAAASSAAATTRSCSPRKAPKPKTRHSA